MKPQRSSHILYLILVVCSVPTTTTTSDICEDYSPCSCEVLNSFGLVVRCGDSLTGESVSVSEVQRALNRTSARHLFWLDMVALSPATDLSRNVVIPADFLSRKSVDRIGLGCLTSSKQPIRLEVEHGAFQPAAKHVGHLEISGFDLSQLDMKFLGEMSSLISLSFAHASHFRGFLTELSFTHVKSLRFYEVPDFAKWKEIPSKFPRLESLYLDGNQLDDNTVNQLLESISKPSNESTLQQLSLWGNRLTSVPTQLKLFPGLTYLNLFGNMISSLPRRSLHFHSGMKVSFVILTNNQLDGIEPGAFHGDFSEAIIYLDYNLLTRFESTVYEKILDQMYHSRSGASLNVHNNPFNCDDCHLSWIIRDKRKLLSRINGARCSNGTRFEDLSIDAFNYC